MKSGKILIVDDDADLRLALSGLLAPLGEILEASDGMEALRALRERKPALMLLDVSMPGMDGVAVLKAALAENPTLTVLMVTGEADLSVARRALEAGARAYITKPFDPATICDEVARHAGIDRKPRNEGFERPWRVRP
jgi:two-component system chemotaxis response regulator CheY